MQIFTKNHQPQVSEKYQIDFLDNFLQEIKVPAYNEYIGTIYMFVNNINGKVYIGQTITKFYSRFCCHYGDAFTKKDYLPFHIAIRKYGWENFSKYILWQSELIYESNPENKKLIKKETDIKEIEYINLYNSNNPEFGYNLTTGGTFLPESAFSKESIEKSKQTRIKNKSNHMLGKTYDKHHLAKHILQYDLDKNFIKNWPCIKLAEDTINCSISPKGITSGGYFWIYESEDKNEILNEKYNKYLKLKESEQYQKALKKETYPVYCFDLFGELVGSYNSSSEASLLLNIGVNQIQHAAKAKDKGNIVHDYIWIYEKDLNEKEEIINTLRSKSRVYISKYKPIYQIYLNGNIIKLWNNFEEISKEYPKAKASINKCLNGNLNAYSNCFWIYEEDYSDEVLSTKLNEFKKTKKKLVEDVLQGKISYTGICIEHDSTNNKMYLKEHPCIYQFDKEYNLIKKWDNYQDVKENGWNFANISKCLRRKMKSAYGFIWRFEEDVLNNNLE